MKAALYLQSAQTPTKRPLSDASSVYIRRNALGKNPISLPIAAHSQRRIACSHVNPRPSPSSQPPSPPRKDLKPGNAIGHFAGSGMKGSLAAMARLLRACVMAAGVAWMKLVRSLIGLLPYPREPAQVTSEAPIIRKTRATLSDMLLVQKRPTPNLANSALYDHLLRESTILYQTDYVEMLNLLLRKFSQDELDNQDYDLGILLVNVAIAMKEYQKAKEICGTLLKEGLRSDSDYRPLLQIAVIDMILAMETMSETEPHGDEAIKKIKRAIQSWNSYVGDHDRSLPGRPPDQVTEDQSTGSS